MLLSLSKKHLEKVQASPVISENFNFRLRNKQIQMFELLSFGSALYFSLPFRIGFYVFPPFRFQEQDANQQPIVLEVS